MSVLDGIRWNLSRRSSRNYRGADAIVVSVPKSGRTWVRFFLNAYVARQLNLPLSLDTVSGAPGAPRIVFTHDLFSQFTDRGVWNRLRGKQVVPAGLRRTRPILVLHRDPRDVIVSLYFQVTRRRDADRFAGTLQEFIRHPRLGLHAVVRTMNAWADEFGGRANARFAGYEALRAAPGEAFREVLAFLVPGPVDEAAFAHALEASQFERMKKVEAAGAVSSKVLAPGDPSDPESFKVRKGRVGGYREYLQDPADLELLRQALERLNPRYGYRA